MNQPEGKISLAASGAEATEAEGGLGSRSVAMFPGQGLGIEPGELRSHSVRSPVLLASELLGWSDETARHWQKLFQVYPEALDFDCDVYNARTVRGLLRHIAAVELRYSERLTGEPMTAYEQVPDGSADLLFGLHRQAFERFRKLLADESVDWEEKLEFTTVSAGTQSATRKKILFHALLHGIRHYAQLATLVRQHGIKPEWAMDFLFSDAIE